MKHAGSFITAQRHKAVERLLPYAVRRVSERRRQCWEGCVVAILPKTVDQQFTPACVWFTIVSLSDKGKSAH